MKYEIWTKAMEEISDRHIVEAAKIQKKRRRPLWLGLTAAAAAWWKPSGPHGAGGQPGGISGICTLSGRVVRCRWGLL